MRKPLIRSLLIGIVAALIWFVAVESMVMRRIHRAAAVPVVAAPAATAATDDFTVTTTDTMVSTNSVTDPYILPGTLAVWAIASAWAYRRARGRV